LSCLECIFIAEPMRSARGAPRKCEGGSTFDAQGRDVNGVLAQGTRRKEHIEPAAACEELIGRPVRNIASLTAAPFEGLIYANVHTIDNPAGEVRAQLVPGDGGGDERGDSD